MRRRQQIQWAIVLLLATLSPVWAHDANSLSANLTHKGYLGISIKDVTVEAAPALGLSEPSGVLITNVRKDSPAEAAGLKENDVIVSYNDTRVEGTVQFNRLVRETPTGRTVTLGILRNGQETQVQATLGSRHSYQKRVVRRSRASRKDSHKPRLGIQTMSLTDQLGDYFGVARGSGVLISSVEADSPAAQAGLRAGDVIVAVAGKEVDGLRTLVRLLSQTEGTVGLTIMRDRTRQELQVTLDSRQ